MAGTVADTAAGMAAETHMLPNTGRAAEDIAEGRTSLGIEFGSTRIKAVLINNRYETLASGEHGWENRLENGLWTYSLDDIWSGLQDAYASLADDFKGKYGAELTAVGSLGFSAMMHGYLAFNKDGKLLVPFRTWRNTSTREAHEKLSDLFRFNIPERWSIAHLYQAILNKEEHIPELAYFTTLAGYVHWKLTGRKVLGVGDASGMFPVDPQTHTWEEGFLDRFSSLPEVSQQPWDIRDILPQPLAAGEDAGTLTAEGVQLLDPSGRLRPGIPMAPPEGDAGTGMVATNSVRPRTGNVSAGTSIFATVVLEHRLERFHPEIDIVATPSGDLAGMSHANNFTSDLNAWVGIFSQFAQAAGIAMDMDTVYSTLFTAALTDRPSGTSSPQLPSGISADADAGGLINYCFYSGEFLAGLEEGRPVFARGPHSRMTLGNFMRAQLFSAFSPVKIGMDIMVKDEHVAIDTLVGHGGIFTTPVVAQRILAAAFNVPVTVMPTASEGGAWGMAVLAAYLLRCAGSGKTQDLADFLDTEVFADARPSTEQPHPDDVEGFKKFFRRFTAALPVEKEAVRTISDDSADENTAQQQ